MPKRYYFTQHSVEISNPTYTVEFHDTEFNGDPIEIDGFFTLRYEESAPNDHISPIKASFAEIGVNITENDTDFEAFLAEVVTYSEVQIVVKIFRNGTQIWKGQLVNDLIEIPDVYYSFTVNLTAACGLARLKNIAYENFNGTQYQGRATILQHVINCLAKIFYQSTWVHNLPIVKISYLTWHEQNLIKPYSGLENIDLAFENFQEYDEFGVINAMNAYDVLSEICQAFHYRVFMSGDCFFLQHINDLNASFVYTYAADYSLLSSENVDFRLYFTDERTEGKFTYYPPQKSSSMIYNYKQGLSGGNLLPFGYVPGTYVDISSILGGNGEVLKLAFSIKVTLDDFYSGTVLVHMRFKGKLQVGSYYLSGMVTPESNTLEWTTTNSDFYFVPDKYFSSGDTTIIYNVSTNFPPAPESGSGNFGISFDTLCLRNGTPTSNYTGTAAVVIYNISLIHLLETVQEINGKIKFSAVNNLGGQSVPSGIVETITPTTIGDGPRAFSAGRLRVYNNNTELWTNSGNWKHDSGAANYINFNKLRLQEIMSLKRRAVKTFDFIYQGFIQFWQYPQFNNERLFILSYELDPDLEAVRMNTIYYNIDRDNIQLNEALDAPKIGENEAPTGSTGSTVGGSTALWKRFAETLSPINEDDNIDNWGLYKSKGNQIFTNPLTSKAAGNVDEILIGQGTQTPPEWMPISTYLAHLANCTFRQTADKTIANTTIESSLFGTGSGTMTIPGGTLKASDYVRILMQGYISTHSTIQNFTVRVKVGTTTPITITGALPTSLSEAVFDLELMIAFRTVGSSGTMRPAGSVLIEIRSAGYPYLIPLHATSDISIDTTKSLTIDITGQWANAMLANTITTHVSTIEML